ncbi:MAG TPA: iron transporter FeoB [Firmicutes bacterium]|uniref:50S ribosome-binding GTPase n=1 Tax=Capillibacterium thermochitinicola TaxID=2699427 RepID=A0A8J6HZJ7_9FIRM|nr:FeoB small GTPase domain-containing protein [Capillibacterium thermochitinicola]MBA2132701.1 50S ribosome-binding GTPase [Capillibacterium thermochitinicola]HHW12704.1 iron transporter FeoB [Bacillota bacterium]
MKSPVVGARGVLARLNPPRSDGVVALAGNPNTGKSTVFNGLTGLNQHTGNWPGKTVTLAKGNYRYKNKLVTLVDLPGTYSLLANSADEQVARDFICFAKPDATVVVVDATCLERNLNLALQVMEITPKVILCVNLIDEAKRKKIEVDYDKLAALLGVPVVPTAARDKVGLNTLKEAIHQMVFLHKHPRPRPVRYSQEIEAAVAKIQKELEPYLQGKIDARWVALRLLDGDTTIIAEITKYLQEETAGTAPREQGAGGLEVVKCYK